CESSESDSEREGSKDEGLDIEEEEEEVVPKGKHQQEVQVMDTTMDEPLGLRCKAARRRAFELTELGVQVEFQRGLIYDHAQRLNALRPTLFKGYDRDLRELYTRSRVVRDEIFLHRYRFRSLKWEQERATVTFSGIWRSVLDLKAWTGQIDAIEHLCGMLYIIFKGRTMI
nr:hypothetical protein [Tanacetum cinerariifolium]